MTSRKTVHLSAAALALTTAALLAPASAPATAAPADAAEPSLVEPVLIGHRGASGYRPEHTMASYELAIAQGADYIEPDLVSTKDGVLVARHENEIGGTTDVADHPEFADRRTTKVIDGREVTGWFTEDFTYRELRTLRAKERLPAVRPDNTAYDGQERIPTFDQVLRLARREGVGVYPETKHPTYFDSIGLSLEKPLVAALAKRHWDDADDPVIIQSFETANLRELDTMVEVPLAQLVDGSGAPYDFTAAGDPRTYTDLLTPAGVAWIASYADGIGVNKDRVLPRTAGATTVPSAVVPDAHAEDLVVHVWTLRRENQFMATNFRIGTDPDAPGDLAAEARAFLDAGVDGIFSDNPDLVAAVLDARWPAGHTRCEGRPPTIASQPLAPAYSRTRDARLAHLVRTPGAHPRLRHRGRPGDARALRAAPGDLRRLHRVGAQPELHRRLHPARGAPGLRQHPHRGERHRAANHPSARGRATHHP